jgi:hypothetical protein
MKEIAFVRADWLEFAASLYPQKMLVYSYTVQVPDVNQWKAKPPENCKVPLLARIRPAA